MVLSRRHKITVIETRIDKTYSGTWIVSAGETAGSASLECGSVNGSSVAILEGTTDIDKQ